MVAAHLFKNGINGKRVSSDQFLLKILDDGDSLLAAVDALARARDPGIGGYAYPEVHAVADGGGGFDGGDFHG
tara:strand:- start:449 stop:667 length:219 start_codon:yes stop_codon:yes gene_type:complete